MNETHMGTNAIRLLLVIEDRHAHGQRSTVRELAAEVGLSTTTCHFHLVRLRGAGLIAWEPDLAASIRPLVTVVAAG